MNVTSDPNIERALVATMGSSEGTLEPLQGDASSRQYFRYVSSGGAKRIVMRMPPLVGSDEGPQAEAGVGTADAVIPELPFVNMQRFLRSRDVRVPSIDQQDVAPNILILEDLGDQTLFRILQDGTEAAPLYSDIVKTLAHMHNVCRDLPPDCIASTRHFDEKLFRWELDHFIEWGIDALHGPSPTLRASFDPIFDHWSKALATLPSGFVHRDFQSKNLMRVADGAWSIIDFQDAMQGPRVYDLVALLCDSYVDLDEDLQRACIHEYAQLREIDADILEQEFWMVAAQRKLKDAGRFIYIDRVKHNPDFLQWFPQSLRYVDRALSRVAEGQLVQAALSSCFSGYPDNVPVPASLAAP